MNRVQQLFLSGATLWLAVASYITISHVQSTNNKSLKQVTVKDKAKAEEFLHLGFQQAGVRRPKEAIANLNKAISIDPYLTDAYLGRGIILAEEGNWQGIQDLQKAEEDFKYKGALDRSKAVAWLQKHYRVRLKLKKHK